MKYIIAAGTIGLLAAATLGGIDAWRLALVLRRRRGGWSRKTVTSCTR
jgi:hypothetical protein